MSRALDKVTIQGFKSIRELKEFNLGKLNVLIGANGSGKSNLVDCFRMLRVMAEGGLREFVTRSGGGDAFFFDGPKETPQISVELHFGQNAYRFSLAPTVDSEIMLRSEGSLWKGGYGTWREYGGGGKEASLKSWKGEKSHKGDYLSINGNVHESVSSWVVYHVHDTSSTAPMRREWPLRDFSELRPDASNIAPFLYQLKQFHAPRYQRICETVQLIAPFFADFALEPEKKGENEVMRLQWKHLVLLLFGTFAVGSFFFAKKRHRLVDQQTSLEKLRETPWKDFEYLVAEAEFIKPYSTFHHRRSRVVLRDASAGHHYRTNARLGASHVGCGPNRSGSHSPRR